MHVSLVVPVYQSAVLAELTDRIDAVFAQRPEDTYEVILVDDGSPSPAIWQSMAELAAARPAVRAIQLTRNFGQQAATLCGLAEATGDCVVTLDDDLQHAPEDIPRLLAAADHDVVIAQFARKHHAPLRRLASAAKGWFDNVLIGKPAGLQLTSFRLLRRPVVDAVSAIRTPHPFLPALLFHVSRDVVGVTVQHAPRAAGRSGYGPLKLWRMFSNLLISNSSLVLRVVGTIGVAVSLVSVALAVVVAVRRIVQGVAVQGWASLMVAVLLIGGLLLFGLGVIGEYLIRLVEAAEVRPSYFVRQRAGGDGPAGVSPR